MKLIIGRIALGVIVFSIFLSDLPAQPGMYNESDIEYQTLFFEAQEAKYKGDTEKEIDLLKQIIKRDKTAHAAYYELARTYLTLGDYEQAQKNADKAHLIAPDKAYYLLTLAEVYEKSEQTGKALTAYKKLKLLNPNNPTVYHNIAKLQLLENKPKEAVTSLQELQDRNGVSEESTRRIFDIQKTLKDEKGAVATLRTLVDAFPDNTRFLSNLASYYMEIDDKKSAHKVYEEIITLEPDHPTATMALMKSTAVEKSGNKNSDNYLSALSPIIDNKNVPLDDKIKELMPHLSTMKKGDASAAELTAISEKLVSMYPEEAKVYSLQGDVHYYQGDFKASEKSYKKAISIDDRKYTLWTQYMQNLWELENKSELASVSEEAMDLYPNKIAPFLYQSISLKDTGAAMDMTREASMIAGKNAEFLNQVSIVETWLSKKTATEAIVKGLDIKNLKDPLFFELAGDLYKAIGDTTMADKLLRKAVDLGASPERISKKKSTQ